MTSPVTQHTVSILQVQHILLGARQRGLDMSVLLRRAGISEEMLAAPLSRVTQTQYARLIRTLRRTLRDELWGLCSQPLRMGSFDQACRLLVHCKTLGEAFQKGFHFYRLLLSDFTPRLQREGDVASVRMVDAGDRDLLLAYAERSFSFMAYGLACWLVARRIPLLEVVYPSMDGHLGSEASRLFHAPVIEDGPWIGYRFESRWLDLPIVQTAQSLQEFLQAAPAGLLVKYRDQARLSERIRRLLRKHLASEMPSLEAVSAALAITPQTLKRRLRDEGLGFQAIKDNLRRDVAIEFLSDPQLTLPEIANRLGFAEASSFQRAFKAWTGLAPGVYRLRQLTGS
jgi:AraC-like DNA-binding protein